MRGAAAGPGDPEAQAAPPPPITAPDLKSESTPRPPPQLWFPCQQGSLPKGLRSHHPAFHGIKGETWLEKACICLRFRKGCVAGVGEGGVNQDVGKAWKFPEGWLSSLHI